MSSLRASDDELLPCVRLVFAMLGFSCTRRMIGINVHAYHVLFAISMIEVLMFAGMWRSIFSGCIAHKSSKHEPLAIPYQLTCLQVIVITLRSYAAMHQ